MEIQFVLNDKQVKAEVGAGYDFVKCVERSRM